jgi:hypothetical protein
MEPSFFRPEAGGSLLWMGLQEKKSGATYQIRALDVRRVSKIFQRGVGYSTGAIRMEEATV